MKITKVEYILSDENKTILYSAIESWIYVMKENNEEQFSFIITSGDRIFWKLNRRIEKDGYEEKDGGYAWKSLEVSPEEELEILSLGIDKIRSEEKEFGGNVHISKSRQSI